MRRGLTVLLLGLDVLLASLLWVPSHWSLLDRCAGVIVGGTVQPARRNRRPCVTLVSGVHGSCPVLADLIVSGLSEIMEQDVVGLSS